MKTIIKAAPKTKAAASSFEIPKRDGIYTVNPHRARKWLKRNRDLNRVLSQANIDRWAAEMTDGRWLVTHEALAFDSDGWLVDGQHRLHAVIQTGKAIKFRVVVGLAPGVFEVIGTGVGRKSHDVLHMAGFKYSKVVAAMAGWQITYDEGGKRDSWRKCPSRVLDKAREDHESYEASAAFVYQYVGDLTGMYPASTLAFIHYNAKQTRPRKADQFVHGFCTGEDLSSGDPRLVLRSKARSMARAYHERHIKPPPAVKVEYAIRAWNAFAKNEKLQRIQMGRARKGQATTLPKFVK